MPLTKRLQYELCDQWREQALRYKDLQREAEDLDRTSDDFEHHVIAGLEQASVFYEAKVQELQGVVDEVMLSVQSVVEVHDMHERATSFSRAQSVDVEGPSQEGAEMREKVTSFLRAQSCPEEMSRFLAGAGDDSGEDEGAARHARGRGMSAGAADEDELAAVIRDALAAIAATDAAPGQDDEDGSEREGEGEAEKRQSEGRSPVTHAMRQESASGRGVWQRRSGSRAGRRWRTSLTTHFSCVWKKARCRMRCASCSRCSSTLIASAISRS